VADNTTLNPGTGGDVVASDDIGPGVKYQRVKLTMGADGVNEGDVASGNPMPIYHIERATYVCNTGPITGATATGTKSLAYLWHPSSETAKKYQLIRINVNQIAGAGGTQRLELRRITAENGTPGGTTGTILNKNPGGAASNGTVRIAPTGAPTRASGVYWGGDVPVGVNGNARMPTNDAPAAIEADEFTLRVSTAEGWEITQEVVSTITTAPSFNITTEWIEL
jgi:hypothetical protein